MRKTEIKKRKELISDLSDSLSQIFWGDHCFDRFIFGNKDSFEFSVDKNYRENLLLFQVFLQIIFEKLIYSRLMETESYGGNHRFTIIFSKSKITDEIYDSFFLKGKLNHKTYGRFLGIPECCIKKYDKERIKIRKNSCISIVSALRYIAQCEKSKIKNDFVEIKLNNDCFLCHGFVPCSPKCKESLKILKESKEIEGKLNA